MIDKRRANREAKVNISSFSKKEVTSRVRRFVQVYIGDTWEVRAVA
jgi:hypothetical protein